MLMGAAAAEQCDSGRQEGGGVDAVVWLETEGEVEGRKGKEEEGGRFPSVARSWRVPNA